jgi:hypothetical protein
MRRVRTHCLTFIVLTLGLAGLTLAQPALTFQASQSPDRLWRLLDGNAAEVSVSRLGSLRRVIPERFEVVRLDQRRLTNVLEPAARIAAATSAPPRQVGTEITLPLPDRTYARFLVQESSIMEPELEAQFPGLKSYRGQGIDDPAMTVRFSRTPAGLHAIVLAADRTFYIDPFPLRASDTETHITFFKADLPAGEKPLDCHVGEDAGGASILARRAQRSTPASSGETLRTYRLAVAATGEYTRFHGGTVPGAFQAIFTTVNRVNAIYENDLAISLRLVAGEAKVIYTDPAADPYTNSNAFKLVGENQKNMDAVLGADSYDIGHVFCVGGGGLASLRSVGQAGMKAQGATGSAKPAGDAFDVDYVAHEMGHQFGANHTFNATTGNCGSGNRNPTTAYEPGSGSTIMAYAGICGESDLQPHSHSYFHGASLEEVIDYVTGDAVKSVPKLTPTNNCPPSVVAGQHFIIPKGTPFTLRATGTDEDGDFITYTWEQFDLGDPSPPDDDAAAARPLFRSFNPVKESARYFPRLEDILSGRQLVGEALPARSRVMNFRVTARDNHAGGGGFGYATATVVVVTDSGPFVVTKPGAAAVWEAGSTQTVAWDVAGTRDAPVSCGSVKISLSLDGGKTFTPLRVNAPNTGTAAVNVPSKPTTQARVMVEAMDNAFFSVSKGDLQIVKR